MARRRTKTNPPVDKTNLLPGLPKKRQRGEPFNPEPNEQAGLTNEIAALRQVTRQALELAAGVESLDETLAVLKDISLACIRLAGLLRTQKMLGGGEDRVAESIQSAIAEVLEEMQHDPK